jgi:hypothetical protein
MQKLKKSTELFLYSAAWAMEGFATLFACFFVGGWVVERALKQFKEESE